MASTTTRFAFLAPVIPKSFDFTGSGSARSQIPNPLQQMKEKAKVARDELDEVNLILLMLVNY